jgi:tRNA-dihydrouridine synthase
MMRASLSRMRSKGKSNPRAETHFWQRMPKPFFVLAPMANVTDHAFRAMFAKHGKPDAMWTEFVSADGLCSPAGRKKLLVDLEFSPKERPIIAQLFTGRADRMLEAAELVEALGFDGLDINMGCPDRAVERQGGGGAMMKDPTNALSVLEAAREGASLSGRNMQVSVKTRIGYSSVDWKWLRLLLEQNLPALTVHLRTRKEMSDVPAHWELMPEIIRLRDEVQRDIAPRYRTLIIGNGDVGSIADARDKADTYGCDGVMIGRGAFGKPWFFEGARPGARKKKEREKAPAERLKIMLEHAKLFNALYCGTGKNRYKNFAVMKKHFKAYVSGWDGAKELRVRLMEANTYMEVEKIVKGYIKEHLLF